MGKLDSIKIKKFCSAKNKQYQENEGIKHSLKNLK